MSKFTEEDKQMADELTLWVHKSVDRIGPVKTRGILEVMLDFDLTRLPLKGAAKNA